ADSCTADVPAVSGKGLHLHRAVGEQLLADAQARLVKVTLLLSHIDGQPVQAAADSGYRQLILGVSASARLSAAAARESPRTHRHCQPHRCQCLQLHKTSSSLKIIMIHCFAFAAFSQIYVTPLPIS